MTTKVTTERLSIDGCQESQDSLHDYRVAHTYTGMISGLEFWSMIWGNFSCSLIFWLSWNHEIMFIYYMLTCTHLWEMRQRYCWDKVGELWTGDQNILQSVENICHTFTSTINMIHYKPNCRDKEGSKLQGKPGVVGGWQSDLLASFFSRRSFFSNKLALLKLHCNCIAVLDAKIISLGKTLFAETSNSRLIVCWLIREIMH